MTFKEAKDILKKEFAVINLHKSTEPFEFDDSNWFGYEKPSVLEAFRVLSKKGYYITISGHDYDMRKKRLEKEYEKNTKAPGPGEEQSKEGNPALKEASSQFNDALLDEQAKKIEELTKEKTDLEDQITILNACKEYNENFGRKQIKRLGKEIAKLNSIIHDKNAVLADVAEELRLSKIREKNLAELGLKYVGENEKLKKELADKVVDKIDAQALKSAESALAYKDEVIETLDKELAEAKHELSSLKRPFRPDSTEAVVLFANAYAKAERKHLPCTDWRNDGKEVSATYILENGKKSKIALDFTGDEIIFSRTDPDKPRKDSLYSYKDKQLAEKDEVIADLGRELKATKTELEEKTKLVEVVRKGSKEYCEYGIAAEKMIQKMAKEIVNDSPVPSKDYKQYRLWANGYRFNPQFPDFSKEEEKKPSLFRDDSVGAVTNQKDCSPVKDTHPTEDNPKEVEMDEILEHVRKVLEEGGTVSTSYDKAEEGGNQSATIVQHRKSIVDLFKEIKRLWQE